VHTSDEVLDHLVSLGMSVQLEHHAPMLTMADVRVSLRGIEGAECSSCPVRDRTIDKATKLGFLGRSAMSLL
jgi:hypothetical protein